MSLQRKLIISFCVFLSMLFITMTIILFAYGSDETEIRAQENLNVIGTQMVQQFDHLARLMDFITVNLISTDNFISSLSTLSSIPRGLPENDAHINRAMRFIYVTLVNDSINRNFYGVNVFNEQGDLFSSRTQQPSIRVPVDALMKSFPWITQSNDLHGRALLIPPRADPWNDPNPELVFSLARTLYGIAGRIGYIEVQHSISELERIFYAPDSLGLKAVLLSSDGQVFYQSGFSSSEYAASFIIGQHEREYVSLAQEAPFTGFTLLLYQDRQTLLQPLTNILRLGAIMMFVFLAVSVMFALALYSQIIKPIRILRRQMESIELETLQNALPTVTSLNDLVALENTFSIMRRRLSEEITRQLRSKELQMQANYDALQLQINPHFLYNVLHVISQKGLDSENNEICEICSDLAAMMRYSTSTLQRAATIKEELRHVAAYVSLMQKRYESRITFTVHADEDVVRHEIPKMTLQQFVENAINHSFQAGYKEANIEIQCVAYDNGWRICIADNGPGFSAEMLEQVTKDIAELQHNLLSQHTEFAIGGMGLLNTYARLWLFFGDHLVFVPGNHPDGGAYVMIEYREKGI